MELPDPVALAPGLCAALAQVIDPRKRRGVRHPLVAVLTAAVCAVAAGARSFVATAEWVADLPAEVAAVLGVDARCPSESTIRRLIGHVDADRFDAAIGAFVQGLCARVAPAGRRRVLAVDGKTVRGSRHTDSHEVTTPGRHLLAVIDQHARVVLGQVKVEGKTNEITAFAPLLDTLGGIDLTGELTVKGNQPRLRRQLAGLPWREVETAHRSAATAHGRREIRTLKGRHHRRGDRVPARRPGHPGHPQDPPGLRPHRPPRQVAHRDRLRDHRPRAAPGPTRRARHLDPRALADRERPALGPRRDLRRRPVPNPYRRRPAGHGLAAELGHQPAPPRRRHQHRRRSPTSRPRRPPTTRTSHDQLTLPTPWSVTAAAADRWS